MNLYYLIGIMEVTTFILFGVDKWKAIHHKWRIPEAVLLLFSLLFGSLGGLLGMIVFHHKTRKRKFLILVPLDHVVRTLHRCCLFLSGGTWRRVLSLWNMDSL